MKKHNKIKKSKLHTSRKKQKKPTKIKKRVINTKPISNVTSTIDLDIPIKKKRKKRGANRVYFTKETENAIIEYNNSIDADFKEKIFREQIYQPLQKLVENIYNTFKFSYFETSSQNIQNECLSHLSANIHKYQKEKGKAFSYFSIVAKNYLILLNNSNYKKFNQTVEIGEEKSEHTAQLQYVDKTHSEREMNDFIRLMIDFWENNAEKIFVKEKDLTIANAVIELFRKNDSIDSYNKKSLYLYIRELARCKTQHITKIINKMKIYQNQITKNYLNDGVLDSTEIVYE